MSSINNYYLKLTLSWLALMTFMPSSALSREPAIENQHIILLEYPKVTNSIKYKKGFYFKNLYLKNQFRPNQREENVYDFSYKDLFLFLALCLYPIGYYFLINSKKQ